MKHFFLTVTLIFLLDAGTKYLAQIQTWFGLTFNSGVAFSWPVPVWISQMLGITAIFWISLEYGKFCSSIERWGCAILAGGIVGNTVDRVLDGRVTDFIAVGTFPTFNVADTAICLGVGLWMLGAWKESCHSSKKK